MVSEVNLSIAAMHRICKKAGAERVSESSAKEIAKVLEEIGDIKIGKDALEYMMHAGRRTLKAKDIKIAAKKMFESGRL